MIHNYTKLTYKKNKNVIYCYNNNECICTLHLNEDEFNILVIDIMEYYYTNSTKELRKYLEKHLVQKIILPKEVYDILETMEVIWKLTKKY